MRLCSLFAGIGGFDLAAHWLGWATAVMVEWDPFARQVLIKNFHCVPAEDLNSDQLATIINAWKAWRPGQPHPTTVLYGDICHFDARPWRGAIDLVCGGFPCQPYSDAGKKLGNDDPRALFPQMLRIIQELRPAFVVGENVRGLLTISKGLAFEAVCAGLEAEGYQVQPYLLPACGVGAPHKRDRFWFVAHTHDGQCQRPERQVCSGRDAVGLCREAAANAACNRCNPRESRMLGERQGGSTAQECDRQRSALCPAANGCGALPADAHGTRQSQPEGANGQFGRRSEHSCEEATAHTGSQCGSAVGSVCGWQPDAGGRCETIGHTQGLTCDGQAAHNCNGCQQQRQARGAGGEGGGFRLTEPPLCGPDDGLPAGLVRAEPRAAGQGQGRVKGKRKDTGRADALKGYGNAIVPQVAYQLFQALEATP